MSSPLLRFVHNGVEVIYDSQKVVRQVIVDTSDFSTVINLFNESNYHAVSMVYVPPELEGICYKIFDTVKELDNRQEFIISASLCAYTFQQFTRLWNYYLTHEGYFMGSKLWQHVCRFTWNWEATNSAKVHKGTPYFFLGATQLMQGNVDNAFLFVYNAMEEDKRHASKLGTPDSYKSAPAYMFSSLINDPRNYMYPYVRDARQKIDYFIQRHNALLSSTFSNNDMDTKFLKNPILEEPKFSFVYNILVMKNQENIDHENLRNNDFSKLRNLDIIFNLCLIIDEVMKQKTNGPYISNSVDNICRNYLNEVDVYNISRSLNFETDFENAIRTCLSLNYSYNSRTIGKEVLILVLAWALRNYGGHNIEASQLLVDEYENIKEKLMSALFITLEKLY